MRLDALRLAVSAVVMSAALSACYVAPVAPAPGGEVIAYGAPPPPRYEAVGVAPYPGWFWVGGGWFWAGGRYVWHSGHWRAPRPGYYWVPQHWVRGGGVWHMRRGHWMRG